MNEEEQGNEAKLKPEQNNSTLEDSKIKHFSFALECMIRASDELYELCIAEDSPSICQDIFTLYENLAFDFTTLAEWLTLKDQNKGLPLPERKNSSPSVHLFVSNSVDKKSESKNSDNKSNHHAFSGINVLAPDFIPSDVETKCSLVNDQSVQTTWVFKDTENKKNESDVFSETTEERDGQMVISYMDSSQEFDFNTRLCNSRYVDSHNFSQNLISSNYFSLNPHVPCSPHFYPQVHIPYSIFPPSVRTPNMITFPHMSNRSPQIFIRPPHRRSSRHTKNRFNIVSDHRPQKHHKLSSKQYKYANAEKEENGTSSNALGNFHDYLPVAEKDDSDGSASCDIVVDLFQAKEIDNNTNVQESFRNVSLLKDKEPLTINETNLIKSNHDVKPLGCDTPQNFLEVEKPADLLDKRLNYNYKTGNDQCNINIEPLHSEVSDNLVKDEHSHNITNDNNVKQNIFGLAEDECLFHFPELTSEHQRKGRTKPSFVNTSKKLSKQKCSDTISTPEVIKTQVTFPITSHSLDTTEGKGTSFSEVIKTSGHSSEKNLTTISSFSSPGSGKQFSRVRRTNLSSYSQPVKQNSSIKKIQIEEWVNDGCINHTPIEGDSDGWELVKTRSKWRDTGDFRHMKYSYQRNKYNTAKCNKISNSSENNLCQPEMRDEAESTPYGSKDMAADEKCEGRNENNKKCLNEGESSDTQNGETSVEGRNIEKIDPNEMYSAYMQYLSNVEEEDNDLKHSGFILHPSTEEDACQNPASLEQMTDFVNRYPIRALDFKKMLTDKIKHQEDVKQKNEVKQQLAHEKRLQFLHDKAAKFRGFVQKVEEVKAAQHQLAIQRKNKLDMKLKKAEEKRNMHLNIIKRKAHDEEEKLKEIAFINELEAQNRRHDSLALRQEQEERLQYLVEERQRRLEEKAAKEAAVEERRKALEAERQEKLEIMKEKRRKKEEFIDRKQQEREKERLVLAREKAREREERLQARHSAQLATLEELQKRIQQKQEESTRRHVECIELIRQKAVDSGVHRTTSEGVSNIVSFNKAEDLQKNENRNVNASHDRHKSYLKKRLKKIKSRMTSRGSIYIEQVHNDFQDLKPKEPIGKSMGRIKKYVCNEVFMWDSSDSCTIDHYLEEIISSLKLNSSSGLVLRNSKAFLYFDQIIHVFNHANHVRVSVSSIRCIIKVVTICYLSCLRDNEICLYFLQSNIVATLYDALKCSLLALELPFKTWDLLVELLLRFHTMLINALTEIPDDFLVIIPDFSSRMRDLISYILCTGIVNKLIDLFRPSIVYGSLLVPSILFFKRLLSPWFISDELISMLKSTDLLGTVPLLYEGLLKHISNGDKLPEYCMPAISLFMRLAEVDLKSFQDILGAENIALQWRGIASGLMTYCVINCKFDDLLNSLIKLVGYFAIHNKKNQTLLQSGKQPTVLQQLVKLPFKYFCDPEYVQLLFPTLISCAYNNDTNKAIVQSEVDYSALEKFMASDVGKNNTIIKLLLEGDGEDFNLISDLTGQ